jgi:hypothetical protein
LPSGDLLLRSSPTFPTDVNVIRAGWDCYNTAMAAMAKILQKYTRRPIRSLGWLAVLYYTVGFTRMTLTHHHVPTVCAAVYFVLLAMAGLICQWGPTAMFPLGGFCATMYWGIFQPGVTGYREWWEIVLQNVGYSAIVAVIGLGLGACLELVPRAMKRLRSAEQGTNA